MATQTADRTRRSEAPQEAQSAGEVAVFQKPRLPWHDAIEDRFGEMGVDRTSWKAIVEAVWPLAKSVDAVVMALSYCKARNLDPFKRPVHIVPMWNSAVGGMVETVWPGISEIRTTAMRTGQYAGCGEAEWGPDVTETFKGRVKKGSAWEDVEAVVTYPEWCRITIYRFGHNSRFAVPGPKVYWTEQYARQGKADVPNEMWAKRPRGQLEKCAEAAALRRAFPEEIGNDLTAEEMTGQIIEGEIAGVAADASPPPPRPTREVAAPREIETVGDPIDVEHEDIVETDDPSDAGAEDAVSAFAHPFTDRFGSFEDEPLERGAWVRRLYQEIGEIESPDQWDTVAAENADAMDAANCGSDKVIVDALAEMNARLRKSAVDAHPTGGEPMSVQADPDPAGAPEADPAPETAAEPEKPAQRPRWRIDVKPTDHMGAFRALKQLIEKNRSEATAIVEDNADIIEAMPATYRTNLQKTFDAVAGG